jgi:ABC-type nitrate/sulfonate/bicarbonate transport system substrate-binding protein
LYFLNRFPENDIKIISTMEQGGMIDWITGGKINQVDGRTKLPTGALATLPKYGINSITDLKGRKVCTGNSTAGMPDTLMRTTLRYNGIDPDKDLTATTMGFDLMPGALAEGTVEAALIWEPSLTAAKVLYGAVEIPGVNDVDMMMLLGDPKPTTPIGTGSLMITREKTLKEKGEAISAFMRGYMDSLTWLYSTPDNWKSGSYLHAISPYEKLPGRVASAYLAAAGHVDGIYDYGAMLREHNLLVKNGMKPVPGWPDKYNDTSVVQQARK